MQLNELKVTEYLQKIRKKEFLVQEVIEEVFQQIDYLDQKLGAYLRVEREMALQKALEMDQKIKNGAKIPPLAGLPVAVKDIICTQGIETTCGSRILKGFIPPYDATVVQKMKDAGAIIIGKTNMDEFGMGSSNENSAFQVTCNPWDTSRVPGGSSGGSAVAVAADEALIALGTDTGGSIRLPASFCGIVGIKPTYGRVSRYGLIAYASSLDQIGILSKSVEDAAIMLNTICGHDSMDSTSANITVPDFVHSCREGIQDLKFAVPREYFKDGLDTEINDAVKKAIKTISDSGGEVEEISLPNIQYALPAYYLIAMAEASSNLAKFDGVQYGLRIDDENNLEEMYQRTRTEGFGSEVIRRIILGTYALSSGYYDEYYLKAQKVRTLVKKDFEEAFQKYDILLCPTSPVPAFRLGERAADPLTMYLTDVYTMPVNLAGLPALSINCGFTKKDHLPIGFQMIGRPFQEENILRAAHNYEIHRGQIAFRKPPWKLENRSSENNSNKRKDQL